MKALAFDSSGDNGTNLVPRLRDRWFSLVAAGRHADILAAREWEGFELVAVDALHPASVPAALDSNEIAFCLVRSMASGADFGGAQPDGRRPPLRAMVEPAEWLDAFATAAYLAHGHPTTDPVLEAIPCR